MLIATKHMYENTKIEPGYDYAFRMFGFRR